LHEHYDSTIEVYNATDVKNKARWISLFCWIASLVFFGILLVWMNKVGDQKPLYQTLANIWIFDILFGIVSFVVLIVSSANSGNKLAEKEKTVKKVETQKVQNIQTFNPWFALSMVLLVVLAYLVGTKNSTFLGFTTTATPTPTSQIMPSVTQVPLVTTKPNTYIDPDPPVHCKVHEKCGGGTKPLKKSECDNSICCTYPDGTAKFLLSKSECNSSSSDTTTNQNGSGTNKVLINIDDGGGLTKGSFYCYSNAVNHLADLQNQIRIYEVVANSCNALEQTKATNCSSSCSTQPDISGCVSACWANVASNCNADNTKVGDLRKQLYSDVHRDCP